MSGSRAGPWPNISPLFTQTRIKGMSCHVCLNWTKPTWWLKACRACRTDASFRFNTNIYIPPAIYFGIRDQNLTLSLAGLILYFCSALPHHRSIKSLCVFVSIVTAACVCVCARALLLFILGLSSQEDKMYLGDAMKSVMQNAWMHVASLLFGLSLQEGCWVVHSVPKSTVMSNK